MQTRRKIKRPISKTQVERGRIDRIFFLPSPGTPGEGGG